jgi:hypothetical protein
MFVTIPRKLASPPVFLANMLPRRASAPAAVGLFPTACCTVLVTMLFAGCGNSTAPQEYHLSGSATFAGKPILAGNILLVPDASKGNRGPAGFATIRDGKFDTRIDGRGTVGGPHRVEISPPPLDVGELSASQTAPLAKPLFREYVTDVDLPRQDTTHDFAVPATP